MSDMKLRSEVRTETGKGQARRLRSIGKIPAIFYGEASSPIMLSVDSSELEKLIRGKTAENIIFDLIIGSGKDKQSKKVMIKEVQKDPVERYYLHIAARGPCDGPLEVAAARGDAGRARGVDGRGAREARVGLRWLLGVVTRGLAVCWLPTVVASSACWRCSSCQGQRPDRSV